MRNDSEPRSDRPADRRRRPSLAELLEKVTPENVHPETDWGPSLGKELLEPWPEEAARNVSLAE